MSDGRVFVLGLDGLDRALVRESRVSDVLDKHGLEYDVLESVLPPITVPAWACSFTGLGPAELGCFDFQELDTERHEFVPVNRRRFSSKGYWNYSRLSSALFDIPGADEPDLDGVYVGGIFDFGEVRTCPEDLAEQLRDEIGSPEISRMEELSSESERVQEARRIFEFRTDVLEWLVSETDEDVYFNVFRLPDTSMHHTDSKEEMIQSYQEVAKFLDGFLEEYVEKEDDVLVVSDHGAVKFEQEFHVNTWLEEQGFLTRKNGGSALEKLVLKTADVGRRLGLRDLLVRMNDTSRKKTGVDFSPDKSEVMEQTDFDSTEAFGYVTGVCAYGGIWVNDERIGGVVENVEKVKQKIISAIETQEEVIESHDADELYSERPENFPDVVVKLEEDTKFTSSFHPDVLSKVSGFMHRRNGFVASNRNLLKQTCLKDVAPTILQMKNELVPEHMEGESMLVSQEDRESSETAGLDF
jgi:predicted AlkP superfamily phosphohydrolase/phosphomutase